MLSKKSGYYASQILQLLFRRPGISRAEVAELLEVDKAIITNVVSFLLEHGYVEERSENDGRRSGRRRVPLYLNETSGCVLGLEVQPEFVSIIALSPSGRTILSKLETRLDAGTDVVHAMRDAIRGVLPDLASRELRLLGIGAGMSGIVDPERGVMSFSIMLGAEDHEIAITQPLAEEFGVPVFVDNDANCCCYGALIYGEPSDLDNFLYVFSEFEDNSSYSDAYKRISVGMGLVLGGRVHYGTRHAAGEFRSASAVESVSGQLGIRPHGDYFAMKSDPALLQEFIDEIARNVGFLANILDLGAVYFGGGIEVYQTLMRPAVERAVDVTWAYREWTERTIQIYFANPGDKPVARGAAAVVLQHIFSGPDYDGFGPVGIDFLEQTTALS